MRGRTIGSDAMAWVLLTATGVLTVLVAVLAVLTVRLRTRLAAVEHELRAGRSPATDAPASPEVAADDAGTSLGGHRAAPAREYVITHVGEPEVVEPQP